MPHSEFEFIKKIIEMEQMWQFLCCWGAIDGCHIPLKCPPGGLESSEEYHNFNFFYSLAVMAIVDSHYRFIWGSSGYPGNAHDSNIFLSTKLCPDIQCGNYLPVMANKVGKKDMPPLLLLAQHFF